MSDSVSARKAKQMSLWWLLLLLNTVKISAARHRNSPQATSTFFYSKISSDYIFGSNTSVPTPQPSPTTSPLYTKQTDLLDITPSPSSSSSQVAEQTRQSIENSGNTQANLAEFSTSGIIIILNTTADSYVRGGEEYKDENYGKASQLFLKYAVQDSSSSAIGQKAILKFDLKDIDITELSQASLEIFFTVDETIGVINRGNKQTLLQSNCIVQVARLVQNNWEEANVTWANLHQELDQSAGYKYLNSTLAAVMNQWVEVDVTSLVSYTTSMTNNNVVSFVLELISDEDYILSLSSKESDLVPKLILVLNKGDDDTLTFSEKTQQVVTLSNRTNDHAHIKSDSSSSLHRKPTPISSPSSHNHDTVSNPLVLSAAAFSGVAAALLGLFTVRHVYFKNSHNTNSVKNQKLKPNSTIPTTEVRAAFGRLQQIHHDHFSGSASVITNDDDKTTSDPGSDESSIVVKKDSCSWFKTLTAFQNTGGSTLGGTIIL